MGEGMGMSLKVMFWWALGGLILYAYGNGGGNWVPLGLYLFASPIVYVASLYLHPRRNCWTCKGSGRHIGFIFDYARRACTACGGSGFKLRLGARLLNISPDSPGGGGE